MLFLASLSESGAKYWLVASEILLLVATLVLIVGLIGEWRDSEAWKTSIWYKLAKLAVIVGVAGELFGDAGIFETSARLQTIDGLAISSANERASNAVKAAEDEKLERVRIEKAIIDELAQRDLTREQVEAISSAIKGRIGTIYLYPLSDPEASRYVFAISETLKRGGVDVKLMLSGTKDAPVFPDKFNVAVSITGVTAYESGGKHEIVDLLLRAFGEAGVKLQGQLSENSLPGIIDGKWVEDAGIQSPAIFVGLRPAPFSQFPGFASPPELEEFLKNHPPPWAPK
jgi:hypothetical protein